MLSWSVGQATVTSIVESETPTSPRYLFHDVGKADALARAEAAPWLRPDFIDDAGYLRQKIQCLMVEVGELVIAVDTCVGNHKSRANEMWDHLDGPFLDDLIAAGFEPQRVTHVVCTHLHVDHIGWNTHLVDGRWEPTFPNARYLLVDAEYRHWKQERGLFDGEDPFGDSVAPVVEAGLTDLVAPTHRISETVRLEPTPGHTPGHVSVVVESGGDRAIITGDMVHHPLQLADPSLSSRYDTDPDRSRETRRTMFSRWSDGETMVIGTHFGTPTAGLLRPTGEGYVLDSTGLRS